MAPKATNGDGSVAPGASAVEALASPLYAKLLHATITEAADALREKWTATPDGQPSRGLTLREERELDGLRSLGAQLVTATTPVGGAS